MASAALGKAGTAQGSGEGGQAGRQAQVGIVLSEPGVLAGTGEGQVRLQHLSAQTHPAGARRAGGVTREAGAARSVSERIRTQ